jgi:alkaline phosphatase D
MSKGSSLKLFIVFCGLFLQITKSTKIQKPPRVEDIKKPLDKIAFGSCNDQLFEQPLWSSIAREKPDLWLWMGDNVRIMNAIY